MTDATPRSGAPLLAAAQAQKHVTHNEALLQFDALLCARILDRDLSAPPSSPADGDAYLVKATATGAWAGQDGKLACCIDGGWRFYAPFVGLWFLVVDEAAIVIYTASGWSDLSAVLDIANLPTLGINTTADATNKLAAKSNAVLFASVAAADGGSGTVQLKLDKEAAADTASILLQTAESGRAEIGLTGDDDFHLKVSADGSVWHAALSADRTSGAVSFAQPLQNLPQLGVNASADATNKFALKSNAALFDAVAAAAGGTGDIRLKLDKEASADTASLLYQTAYSGRAEMGLTGDDDFHFKVSPDGASWSEALLIDKSTGLATVPADPTAPLGVATKQYVDASAGGGSVWSASGSNISYTAGQVQVGAGSAAAPGLSAGGTGTGLIGGTGSLGFAAGGVQGLWLTNAGKFGIGTSPGYQFHCHDASVGWSDLAITSSGNGSNAHAGFYFGVDYPAATRWGSLGVYYNGGSQRLQMGTRGNISAENAIVVDASQRVGINTTAPNSAAVLDVAGHIYFHTDNSYNLGGPSNRANTIYAGSGTINTSDGAQKTDIRALGDAEVALAKALSAKVRIFQFVDAVAKKGADGARLHAGMIAQDVFAAFAAAGLDPFRYGICCRDAVPAVQKTQTRTRTVDNVTVENGKAVLTTTTETYEEPVFEDLPLVDASGNPVFDDAGKPRRWPSPVMVAQTDADGEPRYALGLRYDELAQFILAGLAAAILKGE